MLQAAWKLGAKDGRSSSSRLDGEAASGRRGSLREGLQEMIAGSEIGLTSALRRCLGHGRPHRRRPLGKAPPHRPGDPVERPGPWRCAERLLRSWTPRRATRRIMGYRDLRILKAYLDELTTPPVDGRRLPRRRKTKC